MRILVLLSLLLIVSAAAIHAQTPPPPPQARPIAPIDDDDERRDRSRPGVGELIANQRMARQKKAHADMLKRGEEALKLSEELGRSFKANERLTNADIDRLIALEKAVVKIRESLGGDSDDDKRDVVYAPSSLKVAFEYLESNTVALVDELKKTSRFAISVVAIQTSNNLIRAAKFLRLRK